MDYDAFLKSKVKLAQTLGFPCEASRCNPILKEHQKLIVSWMVTGGRRACFAAFGLGKSVIQLETVRMILEQVGGRGLIVIPLGVRQEFRRDATELLGWKEAPKFIRRIEEAGETGIYLTNYETVRDGKLDPSHFVVASLDEAAVLRGFGGTKTFREFMRLFTGDAGPAAAMRGVCDRVQSVKYRFVATATPSPNEYIELLAYAEFLGVMDVSQAKSQPLDALVLTPSGWTTMGKLKVGDEVIAGDGRATKVMAVYPQGERPVYKVTLDDGTSTECDADHLWLTKTQCQRNNEGRYTKGTGRKGNHRTRKSDNFWTTKTTAEIEATLKTPVGGLNHSLPMMSPVELKYQEVSIAPWLLGFLLGDGYLRKNNVSFSTMDDWIVERVKTAIPTGLVVKKLQTGCDYSISNPLGRGTRNLLVQQLRAYGLNGKRSHEKRIPSVYLWNAYDVRLCILQGLMDSDGTSDKINGPMFCSTSEGLSEDVRFLVQSLGGVAKTRRVKTTCRDAFITRVSLPDGINPFALPRKAERVFRKVRKGARRSIASIELVGVKPSQCIAVENPERLYVTDNFIVTHNTRFFKRDSTKADKLTLHPHKAREFWLWVSSWAIFVQSPEDLGCDGSEYKLPNMNVHWHEVVTNHRGAGHEKSGQAKMFRDSAVGVQDSASEKRSSMAVRVQKLREILQSNAPLPGMEREQVVIWSDLNDEQHAVESALKEDGISFSSCYGAMSPDAKEAELDKWIKRDATAFLSKTKMHGAGVNAQQCHHMVFLGIDFKFYAFIQAVHRIVRFLQQHECEIHIIYSEAERGIRKELDRKWQQHKKLVENMTAIIQEFGLSQVALAQTLTRKLGVERVEISGDGYRLVNEDSVKECQRMEDKSVQLVLTSIPFSTQYEYSPNYADFGHSEGNQEFFEQMDYLTPQLLRVLEPGRIAAIHVKDRIVPGGMTGLGFQTVYPFHCKCVDHFVKHGFAYIGMKTIVTDVVRENNQTYRLGWTEQCKDGTKMGVGMPEYLLLFRRPPTGTENSYADKPVRKRKDKYTRSRWQIDAHGFARSNGNRLLTPEEISTLPHGDIFKIFRDYSLNQVYDFEHHVRIGEAIDAKGRLPVTFMLLQPQSWSNDVWTDITRMLTLNGAQSAKGKEMHLCPMQFDLADRVIEQFSMEGETVLDPFAGLCTVAFRAIKKRRKAIGIELCHSYFVDGATYCKAAADEVAMPTLFDLESASLQVA